MKLEIIKGQRGYAFDMIRDAETLGQVAFSADPDLTALFAAAPEMLELIEQAGEIMIELESLIDMSCSNDASAQKSQWHKDAAALLAKVKGGEA